jgi:short-subunit dehydrogenase
MEIQGNVVLLTGASRGLGRLIALDLAAAGAHLVLAARDAVALEQVAAAVRDAGGQATPVTCDLTSAADRERLVGTASAAGPVEVVVHNAGLEVAIALRDQHAEDVERQLALNLLAPIELTRALLPAMIERGRGCVVLISSMSGKAPTPYNAVYAATKHGLVGFAASLRLELAGTGVHVGAVCPGFVADTGMWAETGVRAPALMREVPPARVVAAVRKVLDGAPEVLVTKAPVRPLLALAQLFPAVDGFLLRRLGVLAKLRERARVIASRRG